MRFFLSNFPLNFSLFPLFLKKKMGENLLLVSWKCIFTSGFATQPLNQNWMIYF